MSLVDSLFRRMLPIVGEDYPFRVRRNNFLNDLRRNVARSGGGRGLL